jgi:hypothetical protein
MHRLGRAPTSRSRSRLLRYDRPGQPADTHKLRCASNPGRFTQPKSHDVDDQFDTHMGHSALMTSTQHVVHQTRARHTAEYASNVQ